MNQIKKIMIGIGGLLAIVLIAIFLNSGRNSNSFFQTVLMGKKQDSSAESGNSEEKDGASSEDGIGGTAGSSKIDQHEDHQESPHFADSEITPFPTHAYWFKSADMADESHFLTPTIPISTESGCEEYDALQKTDIASALQSALGVSGSSVYPDDMHLNTISQFWSKDRSYFQISAVWKTDSPATYRIEFFRFDNPELAGQPETIAIPQDNSQLDAFEAQNLIKGILNQAIAEGASPGARVLEGRVSSPNFRNDSEIVWVNGIPISWVSPQVTCLTAEDLSQAKCRCTASRAGSD